MDDWVKFNETTLPEKEEFYSNLNIEDTTDANYMHAKRVCKDFEIKNLGEYHDLHPKSDTLLLADVFDKMCLKIYHLDPVKFLLAPGLAWQATLKKGIRGGICNAIHRYAKANNKYMRDYDKNKESSILNIEM